MADVARKRGDFEEAERLGHKILDMESDVNRLDHFADIRYWLAQAELEMGKFQEARQNLLRALAVYRTLDMQSSIEEVEGILAQLEGEIGSEG
jgi:tetratricopeptide (TPR) repeat protein